MGFVPIEIRDYVDLHVKSNPGAKRADLIARLHETLKRYKAGERCDCGNPIWVIGSAEVGCLCFTCITGEVDASDDYEIAEASDKSRLGSPTQIRHW